MPLKRSLKKGTKNAISAPPPPRCTALLLKPAYNAPTPRAATISLPTFKDIASFIRIA